MEWRVKEIPKNPFRKRVFAAYWAIEAEKSIRYIVGAGMQTLFHVVGLCWREEKKRDP